MFEKYKKSFQARLITLVILPIVIISVALTLASALKLKNEKENEVVGKLKATALAFRENIAKNAEGDYEVIDGDVYAGELDIQYMEQIFDDFTKNTGIYATLFIDDTRRITSVKKPSGEKATGTTAAPDVINAVLKRVRNSTLLRQMLQERCALFTMFRCTSLMILKKNTMTPLKL